MLIAFAVAAGAAEVGANAAAAATTYRCEVDGRVLYSDAPCATGRQATIATDDPRSAEDRADAARRGAAEHAQVAKIDKDRARQQAADDRRAAADAKRLAATRARHAQTCARLAHRAATAHDTSNLAGPSDQAKTQLKAQRADEEFGAVCKRG